MIEIGGALFRGPRHRLGNPSQNTPPLLNGISA